MRAMMSENPGGPESLKLMELPSKPLGKGQVRVAVKAAGVNFPDTLIIADKYQFKPPRPFAPGHEIAGDITEVGEGVSGYNKGDRVIGMIGHGGYASEAVVDQGALLPMPPNMSYEDGSAFTMTYGTSYYALKQRSDYKPGETLLVTGASGGVGLTAVEIGKAMGARVIAAASTAEKLAVATAHGADATVNYTSEKLTERVMALTEDKGADVCFDPVGGSLFDAALSALGWGGRILLVGFVGGVPQIPANRLLVKHRSALGSSLRYFRWHAPDKLERSVAELLRWHGEGKLKPCITHRLPLERAVEGIRLLTDRQAHGKIVVELEPA